MPFHKRKAISLVPNPSTDDFGDNAPVWVMRFTNEIFTDYEDYVNRYFFYLQKNWQCETTGKSGLSYEEALESEKKAKSAISNKFPVQLRKPLLRYVQFRTERIDAIVEGAWEELKDIYYQDEGINVKWTNKLTYSGTILKVLPKSQWTTIEGSTKEPAVPGQYYVQVLDELGNGIEDMKRVVDCNVLSRDRLAFNKNIIRKYVRECTNKENYLGAPWVVKPSLCKKYGITAKMPAALQKATNDPAPELAAAKKARLEAVEKAKEVASKTREDTPVEPKKTIKYPIEDLDLDLELVNGTKMNSLETRPGPMTDLSVPQSMFEAVVMSWQFLGSFSSPLKLTSFGLKDFEESLAHADVQQPCVMVAEYHSVLMNLIIQDRIEGIAKPILITSTSVNSGNNNTAASTPQAREDREDSVLTEDEGTAVDIGDSASASGQDEFDQQQQGRRVISHRPINERVAVVGQAWDQKAIPTSRDGWEAVLVGLINELGSFESIPNVDRILNHLVPNDSTVKEDIELLYPTLPLEDKINIITFLVEAAASTSSIRLYIDRCRELLKARRLELYDLNKSKKLLQTERAEFDRQEQDRESGEEQQRSQDQEQKGQKDSAPATRESSVDIREDHDSSESQLSRSESRQEKLRRQQLEREQEESKRFEDLARQRAISKAKSAELRVRQVQRKKFIERENAITHREEQIEREMARLAVGRVRPLGKDRFYNRYWYFDGITMNHGTDRIFVQSPSFLDLETLRARDDQEDVLQRFKDQDQTGTMEKILKKHEEAENILQGAKEPKNKKTTTKGGQSHSDSDDSDDENQDKEKSKSKASNGLVNGAGHHGVKQESADEAVQVDNEISLWGYYSEPEQIEKLLMWLNKHGERESALIEAINRQFDMIVGGMQAKQKEILLQAQRNAARRSVRTKTAQASEGYLGYVNRASRQETRLGRYL
ncbi:hypothetical protein BGW38_001714 [Lunasporangiospora selenospora]|uniref:DDT domain-containing protein n=1 Tax=Lunasporangiospora selenospora TaxID=979761 RepID=A0A9P6FTX6_9FUNG|nr:hypothetical protein BGW38_001714 [Lunasporangiospora selenospora]